jgi:hypothetical protein
MGINFRRTVAAINAYCGNNASRELSDGASGDHFATLLENAIEMVNVTPPTKDIDLFFEDLPDTVRQNDAFGIPILLRRLYPSDPPPAIDFTLYLEIDRPGSAPDTTVTIATTYPANVWAISGSLLFIIPDNPTYYPAGEWKVLGYTITDGHTEWNEKAYYSFIVDGSIEFPSSLPGGSETEGFKVELIWNTQDEIMPGGRMNIPPYAFNMNWYSDENLLMNDVLIPALNAVHMRAK